MSDSLVLGLGAVFLGAWLLLERRFRSEETQAKGRRQLSLLRYLVPDWIASDEHYKRSDQGIAVACIVFGIVLAMVTLIA